MYSFRRRHRQWFRPQAALTAAQQAYAAALQAAAYSQQAALLNQQAALGNQGTIGVQLTAPALAADTILQVQNLLNFYGSSCSPTGVYDAQTQAALLQFQTKYGLVATERSTPRFFSCLD